jgi:hypothetical protein
MQGGVIASTQQKSCMQNFAVYHLMRIFFGNDNFHPGISLARLACQRDLIIVYGNFKKPAEPPGQSFWSMVFHIHFFGGLRRAMANFKIG